MSTTRPTIRSRKKNKPASSDESGSKKDEDSPLSNTSPPSSLTTDGGSLPSYPACQIQPSTVLPPGYKEEKIIIFEIPQKWFMILIVLLVILFGCLSGLFLLVRTDPRIIAEDLAHNIGPEGVLLFQQHDRDGDGYLSIEEFEPLVYRLLEFNVTGPSYDVPIDENDSVVTLRTYFEPILMETMSKDMNETLPGSMNSLHGLENWKKASMEWMNFGASQFSALMPKDTNDIVLGNVYHIIKVNQDFFQGSTLSSNRYYPPKITSYESIFVHRLLTMFHPRPFVISRFAAQGSVACVRAYNDKYIEVIFRIHAEFQLNEPPHHPFWFTPAQFTGNLIITRNASEVLHFNMYVPNDKRLNIDMEWLNGPKESESMEVDIGYMPLMQLNTSQPSVPVKNLNEIEFLEPLPVKPSHKTIVDNIEWQSEISLEDAKRSLEVAFYPFKQVPYYNLTRAFQKANEEQKLVHSILLWGALDDQSC